MLPLKELPTMEIEMGQHKTVVPALSMPSSASLPVQPYLAWSTLVQVIACHNRHRVTLTMIQLEAPDKMQGQFPDMPLLRVQSSAVTALQLLLVAVMMWQAMHQLRDEPADAKVANTSRRQGVSYNSGHAAAMLQPCCTCHGSQCQSLCMQMRPCTRACTG